MKAAIYARVSTEEQAQNYSIAAQIEAARNVAAARSMEIAGEYVDEGWSGTVLNRPALERLLKDCRDGKIDVIIVYKIDRFFRDIRHLLETLDFLEECGVKFISATEPFDTSTPVGRYMLGQLGLFAEFERTTFLERARAGRLKRISQGKWWGPAPYGYTYDPLSGKLQVNSREAEVVRAAYRLYDRPGVTLEDVARELNSLGYRTRSGRLWQGPLVYKLLVKNLYCGTSVYRDRAGRIINIEVPALVSEEEYFRIQVLLRERRMIRDNTKRVRVFLLRRVAFCGNCGSPLLPGYGNRVENGYQYYYYTCWKTRKRSAEWYGNEPEECPMGWIRAEMLEEVVWKVVEDIVSDPEKVRSVMEGVSNTSEEGELTAKAQEKLEQLSLQRKTLLKAFRDGLLPEVDFRQALEEIAAEEIKLQKQVDKTRSMLMEQRKRLKFFEGFFADYRDTVNHLSAEEKYEIINTLVKRVEVNTDGKVLIVFKPSSEEQISEPVQITVSLPVAAGELGRKKRGRRRKTEVFYFRLPLDCWERVRTATKTYGGSISAYILRVARGWLAEGAPLNGVTALTRHRLHSGNSHKTGVVFDAETLRQLRSIAQSTGVNISALIRYALEFTWAREEDNIGGSSG